jgi:HPt (histidine-containing phosphotransfer) domain-containing protein
MGEACAAMPIVALTANAVAGMKELFLQNSLNDFISKPVEIDELNRVLRAWLPQDKIVFGEREKTEASREAAADKEGVLHDLAVAMSDELDVARAVEVVGGSEGIYMNVLKVFSRNLTGQIRLMETHVQASEWESFRIEVHGMKSALANIGGRRLSLEARTLELAAQEGRIDYIQTHAAEFFRELSTMGSDLESALKAIQPSAPGEKPLASPEDSDRLEARLQDMDRLLETLEHDAAMEILEGLLRCSYGAGTDDRLRRIREALESYDYDAASHIIREAAEN